MSNACRMIADLKKLHNLCSVLELNDRGGIVLRAKGSKKENTHNLWEKN